MAQDKLKKVEALDSRTRKLLKRFIKQVDPSTFDLFNNPVFQQGRDFLNQLLDPESEAYQTLEKPYLRQFSEETLPNIAMQYGAYEAMDSSGFRQSTQRAGEDLQANIAAMRQNAMLTAAQNALGYSYAQPAIYQNLVNQAFGAQPFAYQSIGAQGGWGQGALAGLGAGAGAIGAMKFGNFMSQPQATTSRSIEPAQNNLMP